MFPLLRQIIAFLNGNLDTMRLPNGFMAADEDYHILVKRSGDNYHMVFSTDDVGFEADFKAYENVQSEYMFPILGVWPQGKQLLGVDTDFGFKVSKLYINKETPQGIQADYNDTETAESELMLFLLTHS